MQPMDVRQVQICNHSVIIQVMLDLVLPDGAGKEIWIFLGLANKVC